MTIDPDHPPESTTHVIFTDGSGNGGWAAIIVQPGIGVEELSGRETKKVTNNRMEMLAAIKALERLAEDEGCDAFEILIFTDSRYLAENFALIPIWKARNWMTHGYPERGIDPGPVRNQDLWERLDSLSDTFNFQLIAIARDSHALNKRADELAGQAASKIA